MRFIIHGKTPTVNSMYSTNRSGHRFMINAAKKRKDEVQEEIRKQIPKDFVHAEWCERMLTVTITIHEDWFTKAGTIRIKDIVNLEKFIDDAIFSVLKLDDSHIWKIIMEKHTDEEFMTFIDIEYYNIN